jgi:hypothetical protein
MKRGKRKDKIGLNELIPIAHQAVHRLDLTLRLDRFADKLRTYASADAISS